MCVLAVEVDCNTFSPDTELIGDPFDDVPAETEEMCLQACKDTEGCVAATFESEDRRCWLFDEVVDTQPAEGKGTVILCDEDGALCFKFLLKNSASQMQDIVVELAIPLPPTFLILTTTTILFARH